MDFKTPKLRIELSKLVVGKKNITSNSRNALLNKVFGSGKKRGYNRPKLIELYNVLTQTKSNEKITLTKIEKKETTVQLLPKYTKEISNRLINIAGEGKTTFNFENYKIDENKLIQLIIKLSVKILNSGQRVVLQAGKENYTLNANNIDKLLAAIKKQVISVDESMESDGQVIAYIKDLGKLTILVNPTQSFGKDKIGGAYFNYYNKTSIDMTRYQIFNNAGDYDDNCMIYALKMAGLDDASLNKIKLFCKTREIPQCKLNEICTSIGIQIILKQENSSDKNNKYGTHGSIYKIGLLNKHYFVIEDLNVSSFCIKNYEKMKNEKNFNHIIKYDGKYYERNKNIKTSSYKIIKLMLENHQQCLEKIVITDDNLKSKFGDKPTEIINLEFNDSSCKLVEKQKEIIDKKINYDDIWFFDFETYQDDDGKHIPYLICAINNKTNKMVNFYGPNCGKQFLNILTENSLLIAHNADYDFRFLIKYLYFIDEIVRDTSFMSAKALYYNFDLKKNINIKIKCSLRMINMALSKFPKCFFTKEEQKKYKKEIMPYDLYNSTNIKNKYVDIDYALKYIQNESDKIEFVNNINSWGLNIDGSFNIIEYSKIYCEMDCILLMKGYNIFRGWMLEITELDINEIISLASLADKFLINKGCYDDIYQLAGVPQVFIMKCVVGGRTMCRGNETITVKEILNDFDAVSLYPSAMSRMGFLKGTPKIIQSTNWEDIKNYDGLFLEIKIKNVGIKRNFPLLSYIDETTGVRNFTNDMVGRTVYLDKISLEDAIKFQNIEFDVIKGYYFNDGFNYKIQEVITMLFNERLKKKKEGNPIQIIYKEILNSAYGKTILKASNIDTIYKNGKLEFEKYFDKNYNFIHSYEIIDGTQNLKDKYQIYRLKVFKPLLEHYNRPHVGSSVLAMSKRIMNEVMCLAEDNDISLYYQDTDSIHITANKIDLLSEKFEEKYERKLIGNNMCQFHSDFDLAGATDIVSKKSIFLGKKSYIDVLQGVGKDGETIEGYHIRLKGIPLASIDHYCNSNNINAYQLYEQLRDGIETKFDLLCGKYDVDGVIYNNKPKFKKAGDKSIRSLKEFDRVLNKVKLTDVVFKI